MRNLDLLDAHAISIEHPASFTSTCHFMCKILLSLLCHHDPPCRSSILAATQYWVKEIWSSLVYLSILTAWSMYYRQWYCNSFYFNSVERISWSHSKFWSETWIYLILAHAMIPEKSSKASSNEHSVSFTSTCHFAPCSFLSQFSVVVSYSILG